MKSRKILVVDDNKSTLKVIKAILAQEGYIVYTSALPDEGLGILKADDVKLCLVDLKMPGKSGLELYREIKQFDPGITVLIMTAYGSVESAVEAMKLGVENYLQKPLNFDELKITIGKLFDRLEAREELAVLRGEREGRDVFENMIGRSKKMREIFKRITNIARTDSTVLITGESGTGKEMAARAIHNLSRRKENRLISINLAAIPEGLQESELFGYEKGAFTGAYGPRKGKFEAADKGTIFLDEIGNINHKVQAKLLRVLEERKIEPLGSNISREIDVRLISATNSDLKNGISKNTFREDLYYRLNVISIHMPPLRERKADIPLLAYSFIKEICIRNSMEEKTISDSAIERLMEYSWPGNIRQLKNVLEEAIVVSEEQYINPQDFSFIINERKELHSGQAEDSGLPLFEMEKKSVINALIKSKGNQTKAAKILGVTRKVIMNKIEKYDIQNIVPVRTRVSKKDPEQT